ncbi:hypothetical protein BHECKSOX_1619 [Bathymodiolus heckerae thiotrophic gill symbiont]|uniref:DUF4902 domain-containing protein n=1 Tax=Bathymodiolus heckerae thiotrophic gill symbiont TaxID=1052212 RepID=UPI0010BC7D6C|nr:DUF4902 domain-containing protein [Bathymodiolus heckerae thiotrophic gill symbiont]SHN92839.1 hypothetical protein BHECKSOX_1619 [Bathymodiolus heckerae thiotrophic gill symbiont]
MGIKKIRVINNTTLSRIITIHSDGYIRLTFEELKQIPLVHLISSLDDNFNELSQKTENVNFSEVTGYTEWGSKTSPAISIGWDWIINVSTTTGSYYKRNAQPRSNLMLITTKNCDIGSSKTNLLIEKLIDKVVWSDEVKHHIRMQYIS